MRSVIVTLVLLGILLILYVPHSPRFQHEKALEAIQTAPDPKAASSLYAKARGPVITPVHCTEYTEYEIPSSIPGIFYVDEGPFIILTGCKYTPVLIDRKYFAVAHYVWNYMDYANYKDLYSSLTKEAGMPPYPQHPLESYSLLLKMRTWRYGMVFGADAMDVAKSKQGVCVGYAGFWVAWLGGNGMEATGVSVEELHHAVAMHSDTVFDNQIPFEKREFFIWKWYLISGWYPWHTTAVTLTTPFYAAFHEGILTWRLIIPKLSYSVIVDGDTTFTGSINGYEGYRYVIVKGKTVTRIEAKDGWFTVNGNSHYEPYWAYMTLLPPAPAPNIMVYTTTGTTYYYLLNTGDATYGEWVYNNGYVTGRYAVNDEWHTFSGVLTK